ncbi:MAG: phosphate acetyltransferase [Pseudomonadota bacterium]
MPAPVLQALRERASRDLKCIVLSEGDDQRVLAAAEQAVDSGIARIILVGGSGAPGAEVHDPATSPLREEFIETLLARRGHKGMTPERAATEVGKRLVFAALLVATGRADGTVGGAVETTSATVRAALQIIGKAPDASIVSSFFLMVLPDGHFSGRDALIFSDAGLVVEPSAEEMSAIGAQSAESWRALTGREAQVAMLSFSTKGSAHHARVTKVTDALAILRAARPTLLVDGELQFDAAFVPEVGAVKAPGSPVAGQANVLIFPNLDAGNIGYKIAQRIGGAEAIGPVLQGLAKPANDLSRGCVAEDIVNMIAVTAAQAQAIG